MLLIADSPATKFFTPDMYSLEPFRDAFLHATFDIVAGNIDYSVYEKGWAKVKSSSVRHYPEAESVIRSLSSQYPGRIPVDDLIAKAQTFIHALADGFIVGGDVLSSAGSPENSRFSIAYLPAVPGSAFQTPSLNLSVEHGYSEGEEIGGAFNQVRSEALSLLHRLLRSAGKEEARAIKKAIKYVNSVTDEDTVSVLSPPPSRPKLEGGQ